MKNRIFAGIALLCCFTLLFAACKNTPAPADESTDASTSGALTDEEVISMIYGEGDTLPYVYLASDAKDLKPGDTLDVDVKIAGAANLGAYQILLTFDDAVFSVENVTKGSVGDLIIEEDHVGNQIQSYGITATAVEAMDAAVLTISLKVLDTAAAGETQITGDISELVVCTDDTGDVAGDLAAVNSLSAGITFTVAA